ncbi:HTH domain-containing protein [Paenibacillus sp. 5J-6]|uniref:HTH domain-containing protein n=1 Tax=Paenibacillus silvestris TaxID=2606219 RepID=A0A6L8V5V8_9BACL|nr:HTH domain-containing protein [Paenibacillus silvestris]MZQ85614.1 HTH domain-containing protein [Paenibacillus silvestris]
MSDSKFCDLFDEILRFTITKHVGHNPRLACNYIPKELYVKPMANSRHFEIVYLLCSKKRTTAKELAEHFNVSTRTIYRNIETLSAAGVPVQCSKGKSGGISLLDGSSLSSSQTKKEQNEFLIALQSLSTHDVHKSDEILSKLGHFFHTI